LKPGSARIDSASALFITTAYERWGRYIAALAPSTRSTCRTPCLQWLRSSQPVRELERVMGIEPT